MEEAPGITATDYSKPWMFQTLPKFNEGNQLNEALAEKEALALAHEPLEVLNGGP